MITPQCRFCIWGYDDGRGLKCLSYPDGVPPKIQNNRHDHRKPFKKGEPVLFESNGELTEARIDSLFEKPEKNEAPR